MHLKRIELVGFKSFANKTVLDFPSGITSIVGPNGSGKSNVIDAIRWVLGEREAKNIRGAKAEDLIFAGTPQKARMGMAQVTMVFDNAKKFFPLDYEEVAIKRQVTRDGVSTYYLNESEVRLKDIIDLFAKARLGTKGLTIVNQGDSDIFVKADPKERRVMIEEVLGLRQYQLKKHDAELKLENTKINLDKTKALIEEMAPHLRLLRRQAAKWEKQTEVEKELRDLEVQYFGGKLWLIEEDKKNLELQIQKVDEVIKSLSHALKERQAELAKVEKSGPRGDKGYEDFKKRQAELLNKKSAAQKELGRLEAQIEFLVSQPKSEIKMAEAIKILEEVRKSLKEALQENDLAAIKALLHVIALKVERVLSSGVEDRSSKIRELEGQKEKILAELANTDEQLAELTQFEAKLAEELRAFNAAFKKAFEQVEAKKDDIQKLENEKNKLLFERERITIRHQELENAAAQVGRKLSEFKPIGTISDFGELERRMFKLRAELAGIGELDPALIKEAQEVEARHNFLSKQSEDLEKASTDLEMLIKELDEKIHREFNDALKHINEQFSEFFRAMFGGGKAHLKLEKLEIKKETSAPEEVDLEMRDEDRGHKVDHGGIEVEVSIPRKKISGLDMLSGGEKTLVSVAALFALISVSAPPFLVLDEVDAPLDEKNARRFAEMVNNFSKKTQFILVTHNRATMEVADILYGVTMDDNGTSRVLSLKLESEEAARQ